MSRRGFIAMLGALVGKAAHPIAQTAGDGLRERPSWMIHRDEIERRLRSLGYVE